MNGIFTSEYIVAYGVGFEWFKCKEMKRVKKKQTVSDSELFIVFDFSTDCLAWKFTRSTLDRQFQNYCLVQTINYEFFHHWILIGFAQLRLPSNYWATCKKSTTKFDSISTSDWSVQFVAPFKTTLNLFWTTHCHLLTRSFFPRSLIKWYKVTLIHTHIVLKKNGWKFSTWSIWRRIEVMDVQFNAILGVNYEVIVYYLFLLLCVRWITIY